MARIPVALSRRTLLGCSPAIAALLADASAVPVNAAEAGIASPDVYTQIGAKPFINCTATITINGGSRLLPQVIEAIEQASHFHVNLDQLMEAAGNRISELLKVPWAMVSSGAAAALTHATAGIVAGTDPERLQQLPDLTGLKSEVIMPTTSRNAYDHAVRMVGLKTIQVDSAAELSAAINHRTALVMVLANRFEKVRCGLDEVVPIAKKAGVPILVDAAADYLVTPNPYLEMGADLVCYSGGKIIRGPQTAGLLLGREELVRAAFAHSAPHHAFGRPMKVSKEEIVGMVAAVDVWVNKRNIQAEYREWKSWYAHITQVITKVRGVKTEIAGPTKGGPFPTMNISWDPERIGITAGEVHDQLLNGNPSIATHASGDGHTFRFRPVAMKPGEYKIVADRLHEVFKSAPKGRPKKLAKPKGDVTGRWDVNIQYALGKATHQVFLEADGHDLAGTHVGSVTRGAVKGTIDGDRVKFRSVLPIEGSRLSYKFSGRLRGDRMEGDLDLGEYPNGTWSASRHTYG
ncbi:MAG: aminotransferase class V-fold PLP-dependent enzyme [bacterium]|nr:aminotransferase class V-fold PLP-dependent enzyme [bacterium]